jgi:acyl-CoA thioesterase
MFEKIRQAINERDAFVHYLGIRVEEVREGYARVTMPFEPHLCNGLQKLHGGASFTIADMAFAGAAMSDGFTTVNAVSTISFTAAGTAGPITAEGRVIAKSKKLCTVEVRVTDGTGTLVALLNCTGYRMSKPFVE